MPKLLIVDPQGGEQHIQLDGPEYIIGRDASAAIPLRDSKVSRKHARIVLDGGAYWIEDLGSANGVIIGGRPITQPRKLTSGTEADIGGFLLVFEGESQAAVTYSLLGLTPPFRDQTFMLPDGTLGIGRVEGAAIVIPDVSVSRKHANLVIGPKSVVVEDLDSANGTFINGTRVARRVVQPGDRIRFGNVEFEFMPSGHGAPVGGINRLANRIARADRSIQIALGIALLSFLLLIITIVVAVRRGQGGRNKRPGTSRPLEDAYNRAIETALKAGREHMGREAWDEAARSFQSALDRDPINHEARAGLRAAQTNVRDQRLIAAAEVHLKNGKPTAALTKLHVIEPGTHYADAAQALARRTRGIIATKAMAQARQACRKGEWRPCHRNAVRVLEQTPDSTEAQALTIEAENAMRARRITFTPWTKPTGGARAQGATLQSMYSDSNVRDAAARYASGSLDIAIKRARMFTSKPGAVQLSQRLADFRRAKTTGDGAAIAGDIDRAVEAWVEALTADARIVPSSHPSVFRDDVRRRMGTELFRKGNAAFGRAVYPEAFMYWNLGLRHNPEQPELLGGVKRLERRAEAALNDIPSGKTLGADSCNRLLEILAMTRPASDVYQSAQARQKKHCRR